MALVRVRRRARPATLAALALVCAAALAQQPFDVALRDGLLSIRANAAPAAALAEALAAETGVRFVVTGDGSSPLTAEIVAEPLEKAIAKLSPNHLLVREGDGADAPVIEIVLMLDEGGGGGGAGGGEFLPSGAPAAEIVPDDTLMSPERQWSSDDGTVLTTVDGQVESLPFDGDEGEYLDPSAGFAEELPPEESFDAQ